MHSYSVALAILTPLRKLPVLEAGRLLPEKIFSRKSWGGGENNMSAFLVEDITINNVVNWLVRELPNNYYLTEELKKLGYNTEDMGKLAKDMFRLNLASLKQRYGSVKGARELFFRYKLTQPVAKIQVLKSLQCWLYQCAEGNVVRKKLYRFFDEVVKVYLMSHIIYDLPEYDEALWG